MHFRKLVQQFALGSTVFIAIFTASLGLRAALVAGYRPLTDLGPSTLEDGVVHGINNHGQLVGRHFESGTQVGVFWEKPNRPVQPVDPFTSIAKINDRRQLVGSLSTTMGCRAAVWSPETGAVVIDPGGVQSCGYGLNDNGQVVGSYWRPNGEPVGFLWSAEDGVLDLAEVVGAGVAFGKDVNNTGQIVGQLAAAGGGQAFLWDPQRRLLRLESGRARFSCANGLNNAGAVVGHVEIDGRMRACLWTARNEFVDLNSLLPAGSRWELLAAWSINDKGQVVGFGLYNGEPRDFLLAVGPTLDGARIDAI